MRERLDGVFRRLDPIRQARVTSSDDNAPLAISAAVCAAVSADKSLPGQCNEAPLQFP
jgi:hypothetical protein